MKNTINSLDKNGFSSRFFEELSKEHDKIDDLANKQKQLKQKHAKSALK